MTPTTPRDVLETIDAIYNGMCSEPRLTGRECERILTALREGGHLRTPGTVEVCKSCKNELPAAKSIGCLMRDSACPFKQVTNEKA